MKTFLAIFLALTVGLAGKSVADQQEFTIPPIDAFLLEEDYEIALVKSAAEQEVSSKATVLVLKETGYQRVIKGTNGITCYVVRSWGRPVFVDENEPNYRPGYLIPECLDPNATKIILPLQQFKTQLATKGTPALEMNRLTRKAFAEGQLSRTTRVSISYMMSNEMRFNTNRPGTPHIMIYLPDDYNNSTVGLESMRGTNGFFIEGGPNDPYTAAVIYRPEYGIDLFYGE